jgi:pimeloyl-ACP methyl ester carboxylesterase
VRVLKRLSVFLVILAAGCYPQRPGEIPMHVLHDPAPNCPGDRILLVMLPGVRDVPQTFVEHGFIEALRVRGLPVDVIAADAHIDYYHDQNIVERLAQDVIAPARAKGAKRIWLLGISLGGMGSLLYAERHPQQIEGLILLAPFLGAQGSIAAIERAGGLNAWEPRRADAKDPEAALLAWLKRYRAGDASYPKMYLGYGDGDRYARMSNLIAAQLPAAQVLKIDGGHNWATWSLLWNRMLDLGLLSGQTGAACGPRTR